jgi:HAD superfamily hydrolase (TIGR01509 family)
LVAAVTASAVFFDLDGTLVDTVWFHTVAWWRALCDHGEVVPMSTINPLIGMGGRELLTTLIGEERPGISEAHSSYYSELIDLALPLPGARDLLCALRSRSARVLLVTSSHPADAEKLLAKLDVPGAFTAVVHGDETDRSKPEPDLFHLALERAGVDPAAALAVGDAEWDVRAAGRAGIPSIAVLTGGSGEDVLRRAGALEVYPSCREILHAWSRSRFADVD